MGWEVYRMIDMEWFDKHIWAHERWLVGNKYAKMFLPLLPTDVDKGTHWERPDPHFPGRTFKMLTMEQANDMRLDAVMATVPDNQAGFSSFAVSKHAKFVVQLGNAEHPVNWGLKPFVLCSTNAVMHDFGKHIYYDQELDPSYRFTPVPPHGQVTSLIHDWGRMDYEMFQFVGPKVPWTFKKYGFDGVYLESNDDVVNAIKDSAAIWHAKAVGDGWGHVIHGAMAIGRPLIGVRRYYRGKKAERFWTPKNTLDIWGLTSMETVERVSELLHNPERLIYMGEESRRLFEEGIDYVQDAKNIERLLG